MFSRLHWSSFFEGGSRSYWQPCLLKSVRQGREYSAWQVSNRKRIDSRLPDQRANSPPINISGDRAMLGKNAIQTILCS